MAVVVCGSAVILGEDALGCLADLDDVLVIIFVDRFNVDRCYVRKSVVDSDLAVVGILRLEVKRELVFLLCLLVVAQLVENITLVEVVNVLFSLSSFS